MSSQRSGSLWFLLVLSVPALVLLPSCSPESPSGPSAPAVTIRVENEPCVAPATGPVSCTFVAVASGADGWTWGFLDTRFGRGPGYPGPRVSPVLDCSFSSGAANFDVMVRLSVRFPSGSMTNSNRTVQMTRAASACGS